MEFPAKAMILPGIVVNLTICGLPQNKSWRIMHTTMIVLKTDLFTFNKVREATATTAVSRRAGLWRMLFPAVLGLLLGVGASPVFADGPPTSSAPTSLIVDDVTGAVGTEAVPYFGWLDNDANANEIQTGYQILVATNAADLAANFGDVWDSGQVAGSSENHVVYAGVPLTSDTQYYWQVRTWNREGNAGPYSTNSNFTVGLLANSDWSAASWIWRNSNASDDYTYYRKSTNLPAGTVTRATVYVSSVQKYALYVNGTLVGKGPIYAFPMFQFYNAYDITSLVTPGVSNVFAMFNHWFGGGSGRVAAQRGVLMEAIIHYADGSSVVVGTDGTWLQSQATSWTTGQSSRGGSGSGYIEKIDARNLTPTWNTNGFDDSAWANVAVFGPQPNSTFSGTPLPDLTRIVETVITPVSVANLGGGNYMVDLGKLYSGVPCIQFSNGTSGTTITMMGGFATNSGGTIDTSRNQTVNMTYYAVLNGTNFTYQAAEYETMRYFLISSSPMPVTTDNFKFIERNSRMDDASSSFTSPNTTLNAVWGLMKQTLPIDAQEEFIDSIRQKGGFLGDGYQESLAAMEVENERVLTRSRLNEFIESMVEFWSRGADIGRVNACYPDDNNARDIPDYTQMYMDWVWEYYLQTGDIAFLNTNYTQLTNIAQYVNRDLNPANGLITRLYGGTSGSYTNGIIDWPPNMQFGYDLNTVRSPGNTATVIDGWAWEDYDIMSRIASEVGNTADSATYRAMANALQAAINTNLINAAGVYIDGLEPNGTQSAHASQHANAFPLSLNIVPTAQVPAVTSLVVNSNMSVSALGIIQLVRALGEANQGPALLDLYTNATQYGWAQILSFGGSATWESWTANTDGNSESHGWGAVGLDGYVRYILGIKPLTAQFDQVQIMPLDFGNNLSTASGTVPTDRGAISVEWDRSATLYHLVVTIPDNVTATVYVPQTELTDTTVNVDGVNVTGTLTNLDGTPNGYLGVSGIGSGTHNIQRVIQTLPMAAFSGTPTNGIAPLNVTFANLSINATNFVWNFGDGNKLSTTSNTNVTDTYTSAGSYTVILTATGLGVTNSLTNTAYIVATNPPPPVAGFSGTPTNGAAPLSVTFTNLSSNATNYVWSFGDGNTLSTTSKANVTDIYTNAGSYMVVLTAAGLGGTNSLTNTAYIVVTNPPPPVAGFNGTPTNGAAPLTVTFTNLSSYATNYVWNFGDGNTLSTTSRTNVTDTYANPGSYTVILTATGLSGTNSLTNTAYIVVTNPPPVAGFSGTPISGVVPLTVTFTNLSSSATNYVWNFGDGNTLSTSSKTNVTDTYTNAGSYTVILTATGPAGTNSLTNTAYIMVTKPSLINMHDGTTAITYAASATVSQSVTVTAGATVLVVLLEDHGVYNAEPATLTWNGATLARAVQQDLNATTYRGSAIYYCFNPPTGTATLSVTVTGADATWLTAYTLSGTSTNAPLTNSIGANATGTNITFNVVGVTAGSWAAVNSTWANTSGGNPVITGTGGTDSHAFSSQTTPNTVATAGYVSGLSGGTDAFSATWVGTAQKANFAAAVFLPLGPPPTDAWTAATGTNWDFSTANWTNSLPANTFTNGDAVLFNDAAARFTVNLTTNVSPSSVTFSNSANNYTIGSAGGFSIAGGGTLTLAGAGTVTLNNSNTYAGSTTISNGTLLVRGGIGNGPVNIFNGGTLGGGGIIGGAVTNQSGGTLAPGAGVVTAGTVLTINSSLTLASGSASIMAVSHNNHTNDQIVSSGVSYGGTLTVITNAGDGALIAGDTFRLFNAGTYGGSVFSATKLPALSSGLAWSNSLTVNGNIKVVSVPLGQVNITNADNGGNLTVGASWIGGVVPVTTNVAVFDSTIISANPAYATNVLGADTAWGEIQILNPAVPVQISAGNTLTLSNLNSLGIDMSQAATSLTLNCPVVLGAGQAWWVASGQMLNVNGIVSGGSILTLNGGGANGSVIFGAQANTYTGGTVINGGVVLLGNAASLGAGAITNNGGILRLPSTSALTITVPLNFTGTSTLDENMESANVSLTGSWSGNGTIIITNMSTFGTTITMGGASSTATMNYFSGKIIVAPTVSGGGASEGTLRFNTGITSYNFGSTNMSVDLGPAPSAVALCSRNSGVTNNLGELKGGPNSALIGSRSANGVVIWSIGMLGTSTTFAGTITNSYGGNSSSTTLNAGGVCAMTKVGAGTLTLTGLNYYTGNTTFSGGVLCAGSAEATVANPIFTGGNANGFYGGPFGEPTNTVQTQFIFNGGTLQYSAANHYDYSSRFSTAAGQDAISIDVNGQSVTFATALTGSGGSLTNLDSAGGGRLILTQPSTYTGGTTVNGGTLLVNNASGSGTGSGNVTVNSGATLGGSGTIAGAVTNQSGGILAPGAGVVTVGTVLTIASSLTLASGSASIMAVSHNGHTNDQVVSSGVSYGGTLTVITNATDGPLVAGDTFQLFKSGTYGGSAFSATNLPTLGSGLAWSNSLAINGSIKVVSIVPPPPVAGFSGGPTNIFVTQLVTLTDASTGSITNWVWNYGDGNAVTNSSNASVTHAYPNAGSYTVSLTVSGLGGTGASTQPDYVVVKPKAAIGGVTLTADGKLVFSGTNGPAGEQYRILTTTDVSLPLLEWTPVWTNMFAADGSYNYTNTPGASQSSFFLLVSP
jgi:alpha-L-rhamnosidase